MSQTKCDVSRGNKNAKTGGQGIRISKSGVGEDRVHCQDRTQRHIGLVFSRYGKVTRNRYQRGSHCSNRVVETIDRSQTTKARSTAQNSLPTARYPRSDGNMVETKQSMCTIKKGRGKAKKSSLNFQGAREERPLVINYNGSAARGAVYFVGKGD